MFLMCLLCTSLCVADGFRVWTEKESGRTMKARLVDKTLDDGKVRLARYNGTTFWMESAKFIEADQKFIREWFKKIRHIEVQVIGSKKGKKTVKVKAVAGLRDIIIKAYYRDKGNQPKGYPKVHKLKKGKSKEFTYTASNTYVVKAFHNKEEIEVVSWRKKNTRLDF